ncbi:MAG: methionine gamma-lyase family protein, partial [Defluviitaleaceae bacterium]|nr:methionine gamma-lyase family protein [Defluviitaleaceae bacterium]
MSTKGIFTEKFGIKPEIYEFVDMVAKAAKPRFEEVEEIAEHNQAKVLAAFVKNGVSEAHFAGTTG